VFFAAIGMLAVSAARGIRQEAVGFLDDLPATVAALTARAGAAADVGPNEPGPIDNVRAAAAEIEHAVPKPHQAGATPVVVLTRRVDVAEYVVRLSRGILVSSVQGMVVGLLTILVLASGDLYKRKLVAIAGPRWSEKRLTLELIQSIDRQIERYLLIRLLISAIVGVATAMPLWLLGVNRAAMWGLAAGVLNVLPFIGPSVACALIALAALVQFRTAEMAIAAGGAAAIVAAFEGNVLTPWLTSRAGELNTVAVFVSVLFWGWMWDVWGLLLAIPIMVAVKAAADRIEPLQPIGELLGQ
jgi:predicted PurR-regulated permease PerM